VEDLIDEGALIQGHGNSLIRKLDVAIAQMNRENTKAAINMLEAFVNHVHGLINEGVLAPAEGQTLIDAVNRVIDSVG
jgi:hypothetical protein